MERLKAKLYSYIEKYGLVDTRTIKASQELDLLIVAEQRGKLLDTM